MDAIFSLALTLGLKLSGVLLSLGFAPIYGLSIGLEVVGLLYGLIFLKNSLKIRRAKEAAMQGMTLEEYLETHPDKDKNKRKGVAGICDFSHVVASFKCMFKRRELHMRHVVVMLVVMFGLYSVISAGAQTIDYSYIRKKFIWEDNSEIPKWWSNYTSIGSILNVLAIAVLAPTMSKILGISDMFIVAFALTLHFFGFIVILVAEVKEVMWLARVLSMFSDVTTIGVRAALTKIVGGNDVGKIFACIGVVQAGAGFISPLYNIIYLNTLDWHFGLIYCLNEVILIFMVTGAFYAGLKIRWYNKAKASRVEDKNDEDHKIAEINIFNMGPRPSISTVAAAEPPLEVVFSEQF